MAAPRLTPPEPVDLVPVERVRELIARTQRELTDLGNAAEASVAEADELEAHTQDAGLDDQTSTWTMVRLQRFLDDLRAESDSDVAAIVQVARQRARIRLDEARAAAAAIRAGAPPPSHPPAAPVAEHAARPVENVRPATAEPDPLITVHGRNGAAAPGD